MILTANEYLDARQPHWKVAETDGGVKYDLMSQHVIIKDAALIKELKR